MARVFRIISIDGGGIRGILPARVLTEIEDRTSARVGEQCELIAGTSTGGLLALGLARARPHTGSPWSASDLLDLYQHRGSEIFTPERGVGVISRLFGGSRAGAAPWVLKLRDRLGLDRDGPGNARYSPEGLEALLSEVLGSAPLNSAAPDVVVTSHDMSTGQPLIFRSQEARSGEAPDVSMEAVARATSAAPTYFPPKGLRHASGDHVLVDGGVIANNPALVALTTALAQVSEATRIRIISIGTGHPPPDPPRSLASVADSNWLQVAIDLLQITFDGSSALTHQLLDTLSASGAADVDYLRLQPSLGPVSPAMDDASPAHTAELRGVAEQFVEERNGLINDACEMLSA